jgi:methylated-DNA-[protein]-cysteine S-methyltransferase
MTTLFTQIPSPVGDLLLAGDGRELSAVWIDGQRWAPVIGANWRRADEPFEEAARQLKEYFAGERFAETRTYGGVAASLGRPSAARAVGAANGQNPFCIVVPCHRLIGAGGGLVDYAAGVEVKRWLLDHETRVSSGVERGRCCIQVRITTS